MLIITPQSYCWLIADVRRTGRSAGRTPDQSPAGKLRGLHRLEWDSRDPDRHAVARWLKARRIKTAAVWLCLPRTGVFQKYVRLPSEDEQEIRTMAQTHALSWWPFPAETYLCHARLLSRTGDGHSDVCVTLVPRTLIDSVAVALPASMELQRVFVSSSAFATLLSSGAESIAAVRPDGWEWVQINDNGHALSMGYPESPLNADDLAVSEVRKIFSSVKERASRSQLLLVTPDEHAGQRLAQAWQKDLACEVVCRDPLQGCVLKLDDDARQMAAGMPAALIAAALPEAALEPNLRPDDIVRRQQRRRQVREWARAGVTAAFTAVLLAAVLLKPVMTDVLALQDLKAQRYQLQPRVAAARSRLEQIEKIERHHAGLQEIAPMMAALYEAMPQDIWLQSLSLDGHGSLTMTGQAEDATDVERLHEALLTSPQWLEATLGQMSRRRQFQREIVTFTMTARWQKGEPHVR